MTDEQVRQILQQVDDLLNDDLAASRLGSESHARLEHIRSFLRSWLAIGPELSDQQKSEFLINMIESLKEISGSQIGIH